MSFIHCVCCCRSRWSVCVFFGWTIGRLYCQRDWRFCESGFKLFYIIFCFPCCLSIPYSWLFSLYTKGIWVLVLILIWFFFPLGILDGWFICCWYIGTAKWRVEHPFSQWRQLEASDVKGSLRLSITWSLVWLYIMHICCKFGHLNHKVCIAFFAGGRQDIHN